MLINTTDTFKELKVKEFKSADIEWLRFICECRYSRKFKIPNNLDATIGKVADDNTREVLQLYASGFYNNMAKQYGTTPEEMCIKELMTDKLKNQICMYTQKALNKLVFVRATVIQSY